MDTSSQPPYLLGLRLGGRRVTVIGGGAVAARRVPALLEAGARVRIVSPRLGASLQDLAGFLWTLATRRAERLRAGIAVRGFRGSSGR